MCAWLENAGYDESNPDHLWSRPSRARGLKLDVSIVAYPAYPVAPLAGAWPESVYIQNLAHTSHATPSRDA